MIPSSDDEIPQKEFVPPESKPMEAQVTFKKPKKRMGRIKKTLVGICLLGSAAGGFVVGAAFPSPTELTEHYLSKGAMYSTAQVQLQDAFPPEYMLNEEPVSPLIENFYTELDTLKDQAMDDKAALEAGGPKAYWIMAQEPKGVYEAAKTHFSEQRFADVDGLWIPGGIGAGVGVLGFGLLAGLGYAALRKKK